MFVSINIYFRPYEFLFLSLSFFENAVSIACIKNYLFGMVKIVSVLLSMFTLEYVLKNDFEITVCRSVQYHVNGVCTMQNTNLITPQKKFSYSSIQWFCIHFMGIGLVSKIVTH